LRGSTLKITGKQGFGRFETDVDLADVAPHFQRTKHFLYAALRRATIYLFVVVLAASLVAGQRAVPPFVIALIAMVLALPGIAILFRFSTPIEVETFRSRSGIVVFDLIREKKQAADFDAYVEILRKAVLSAQSQNGPNHSPDPTLASGTSRAGHEPRHP